MKNENIAPICKIEIIDGYKVKKAKEKLENKQQILDIANIFKILGEPTRLKIVVSLINSELCVCDLAAAVDSTISSVSHQLRLLRNSRLVRYRKEGKMVYYSIEDEHINILLDQVKKHTEE